MCNKNISDLFGIYCKYELLSREKYCTITPFGIHQEETGYFHRRLQDIRIRVTNRINTDGKQEHKQMLGA